MSLLSPAIVVLLAAQAPQENLLVDGVAVQAGEELVTLKEYERILTRIQQEKPPGNREEEARQRYELLRDLGTLRLEEQKGQDLGLDPAQIARINRANLRAQREKTGLQGYLAELRKEGKDALADEADEQRRLLRGLWEASALGYSVAAQRATRDRFMRPGEMVELFEEHKRNMAPITVRLRWLIVSSQAAGGPEAARASCEDARARVLSGEDLALIVEEIGAEFRDTRGLTPPVPPKAFREPMAAFAETAEIGDLSEVLPLTNPRTGQPDPALGYQLAELYDRATPPLPEFGDPAVQRVLRDVFARQRRDRILGRERENLRRDAYSWVNPIFGGPSPSGGPRPP